MLQVSHIFYGWGRTMGKSSKVFDIIVLAGMVVNIILAVFLILYYFDFL
jgi:hypothetical protein